MEPWRSNHPSARDAYAAMKREAALFWRDGGLACTEAKSDLVMDLPGQAERWAAAHRWRVPPAHAGVRR